MPAAGVNINGNWSAGNSSLEFQTMCRYEPKGVSVGNQFIVGQDGEKIIYACIVYMPLPNLISSTITGDIRTSIFSGERLIYDVPTELDGLFDAIVPETVGKNYYLSVNGNVLKEAVDFEKTDSGFRLIGPGGNLHYKQRFEVQFYYTVTSTFLNDVATTGIDYPIKPGSLFEVWEGTRLITKSKVLQFYRGQLNMRVWL